MKKYISYINNELIIPFQAGLYTIPINNPQQIFIKIYKYFSQDSLYLNSIYLMLSTGSMSFFGFFFWIINARLYTTEQIGVATVMISLTSLINGFSTLGLNNGIVRYLPSYREKNTFINTAFTIVGIAALLIAVFYLTFINVFSPQLLFIKENIFFSIFFVLFACLSAINVVSDSVFIAYKSAKYIFVYNFFYSITRLILPVAFIAFGATGIFLAHTFGVIICLFLTVFFLYKKFNYKLFISFNKHVIGSVSRFSLGNYLASFIGNLPSYLFPLFILNKLGAEMSAYYYMDMMIVGFLYMIPISISQSQLAESSHEEQRLQEHITKSIKINALILIPAIILTIVLGKFVLLAFGEEYSTEGLGFLWLMAFSTLTVPVIYTFGVYLKVIKKITYINFVSIIGAITTVAMAYLLVNFNLYGVGLAIIGGQVTQIMAYALYVVYRKRKS